MTDNATRIDHHRTRRLRDALEPLAACVYFAPQTHQAFVDLGFGPPNPGFQGVVAPNGEAYFTSRGACMGRVSGEVVTAAFGDARTTNLLRRFARLHFLQGEWQASERMT